MTSNRIPILFGSCRQNANTPGVAAWVTTRFNQKSSTSTPLTLSRADSLVDKLPLGPVTDPMMAAMIRSSSLYQDPAVRAWSDLIRVSPALVIVTPQYNWGYPGQLKNALDQLYHEWDAKPVLLVTFGGHGGSKAAAQLEQVLTGGLKMELVGNVQITLPPALIRTEERANADSDFLKGYEGEMDSAIIKLLESIAARNSGSL
jgi:NAD(P)H-dependent FMN reductase